MTVDAEARALEIMESFASVDASAPVLLCDRHAADSVAFRFVDGELQEQRMTFGELADRSRRIAALLAQHGVGSGDRVATLMSKDTDLPAVMLGIWRLGAVYVPLFTAFAESSVVDRLEQAAVRIVVTDEGQISKIPTDAYTTFLAGTLTSPPTSGVVGMQDALTSIEPWQGEAPTGPDVPLTHMFTSGTTGKPKAVVHPLSYTAGWQSYLEFGLGVGGDGVYWNVADPGWAYGLYAGIIAPMAGGVASIVFTPKFDAEATWQVLDKFAVTDMAAAPTVYRALRGCAERPTLQSLKRLSSAGEPLTPDVFAWAQQQWALEIHDHFGQTELGMCVGFAHHAHLRVDPVAGAMGRALPGWAVTALELDSDESAALGEVGRLAVRVADSTFFTFTGYGVDRGNRADRFTADGERYVTGDLISIDESGLVRFSARDDDVILMAGYRIGPFDVESALATHPAVQECAVIAAPDEMRGEIIHAFVVPTPGAVTDHALVTELQVWVKNAYASHAYPRRIDFVEALPKTPSGKVQRAVLRQGLAGVSSKP